MDRVRHTYRALALRGLLVSTVSVFIAGHAGCLSLNPSYNASDSHAGSAGGGTRTVDEDTGNLQTPPGGEATLSSPPHATTTSVSTLTSVPSGQISSTGSSGAWLTTSVPSDHSGWTTTGTTTGTSSSTSTGSPTRWGIEIQATDVTETLLAGYPFSLTFDHRAMVAQGAAIDGSDLAVISERGGSPVSLPRVLDRESQWNRVDTKIWFTIDSSVSAGSTVSDGYFLVTQDPSLTRESTPSQVFLEFEDFDGTDLDAAPWSRVTSSQGTRSAHVVGSRAVLSATPPQNYPQSYITIRRGARALWASVRIDARTRFTNSGLTGNCGRVFPLMLTTPTDDLIRTGLRSDLSSYAAVSYSDGGAVNELDSMTNLSPSGAQQWETHSLTWRNLEIRYYRDESLIITTQSKGDITQPNQRSLQLEFSAGAQSSGCAGTGALGLEIDWYRVRRYTFPEPTTRLQ